MKNWIAQKTWVILHRLQRRPSIAIYGFRVPRHEGCIFGRMAGHIYLSSWFNNGTGAEDTP